MDRSRKRNYLFASNRFAQFAADGSNSALGEALAIVTPDLLRTAFALTRRADDAAEMVQDTLLAAIQSRHRFEPGRELVPWLVGILQNLNRHRRRALARQIDPEQLLPRSEDEPSTLVDRKLVLEQIERGIDTLPPTYRQVVSLHLRDGLRPEQIGRILDRPPGRIRTQLWRGLRQLRDVLPGGLATMFVAMLALASARAQDGAPIDAGSGSAGPLRQHLRASRWSRRSLAILAPLAGVVVGAILLGLGAGPSRDRNTIPVGAAVAAGKARARTELPATVDAAADRVAVDVGSRDGRGTVRVHLVWADTLQPAVQQSVRIQAPYRAGTSLLESWFDNAREGTTDGDGIVAFEDVPAGTARLLFDDAVVQSNEFPVTAGDLVERTERLVPMGEIEGVVVDSDGRPVADASVWLSSTAGTTPGYVAVHTTTAGKFVLRALHARWRAWATAAGYARSAAYFDPDSISISRPRLVLWPLPASIDGTIRTSDGRALAAALVAAFPLAATRTGTTATPAAPSFERTDARGHFSLSGLEPGPHLVVARAASTCAGAERVAIEPGATAHLDLRLGGGATVHGHAGPGSTAGGTIVSAEPQRSEAWSGVGSMLGVMATVRADGTYCLEHVVPGVVDVRLAPSKVGSLCSAMIDVFDGQIAEVDLLPVRDQEPALTGRVVDERGGPVAGIEVRSMPAGFDWLAMRDDFARQVTDADGRFSLSARPGLSYRCIAMSERGFAVAASGMVQGGGPEILLTIPAATRANCSVCGVVVDAVSSTPLADIDLCQLPLCQRERRPLGPGGRFEFERLPPGDYTLLAAVPHDTLRSRLTRFHVEAGEARDLGAILVAAGSELTVRMRRADGRPVRLATPIFVYTRRDDIPIAAIASAPGGVAAQHVAPDDYQLRWEGADFLPERRDVTVAAGRPTELAVDLRPARTCSFTFTLPDQRYCTRLWLHIEGPDGRQLVNHGLAVPNGLEYRFDLGLPPGANHVHAVTALGLVAEDTVIVPHGDPTLAPPIAVNLPLR